MTQGDVTPISGRDERSPDLVLDLWRSLSPMGDGKPCPSCGGNDGYGPPPHHAPDCYFASADDAANA